MYINVMQIPCTIWNVRIGAFQFAILDDNSNTHHMYYKHDMDNDGDMDWEHVGKIHIGLRTDCGLPIDEQTNIYQKYAERYVAHLNDKQESD